MERIKVLLADPDIRFTDLACRFLKNSPDIEIVGCKDNGNDAIKCIQSTRPDVVLFDLMLPGLDGISLLRKANALTDAPAMVCCTRFYSDVAMEAMRSFGAAYIMYKPIELQALHHALLSCAELHRRMRRISREIADDTHADFHTTAYIRNYIVSLGIPSKLIGCSYLTEAVRLGKLDASLVRNLSKGLYLEISRSMDTTPERIERCIRNAISVAHQSGGLSLKMPSCPSNKEFINFVIRSIDM